MSGWNRPRPSGTTARPFLKRVCSLSLLLLDFLYLTPSPPLSLSLFKKTTLLTLPSLDPWHVWTDLRRLGQPIKADGQARL
ncbi:hypothetical protein IE53DRAFT_275247 [Violaceomyces palustris]|uniref:Uncharacterized protein n=1 Tax=Violaceomyces palustris TaxID=1673888 RepID=A0ACD0NMJ7_9BASI|nr:hypothetical protein IE53DRAFT_275247 [Violaceomyces palustris]